MKNLFLTLFLSSGLIIESFAQTCPQTGTIIIPTTGLNSSSLPLQSYSNIDIIVNGDFVIDNFFSTTNCYFYIADNVSITVEDNSTADFLLLNSRMFSCGNVMWNGILVKDQGNLDMAGTTLEDAKIGVHARNGSGIVKINGNSFNKNHTHILAEDANASNIIIVGNDFTCRDLGNPFSNYGNTLESPYLNSITESSVKGLGTYNDWNIGSASANPNNFYECFWGIRLEDCSATIKNNFFEDIADPFFGYPLNPAYPYYPPHTAIIAFDFVGGNKITIGGSGANEFNTVHNCNRGFDINDYRDVFIANNELTDDNPPVFSPPFNGTGIHAIVVSLITHFGFTEINILDNHIEHYRSGISYYFANQTQINFDQVNIDNNNIERNTNNKGLKGITVSGNLTNITSTGTNVINIKENRAWNLNTGVDIFNISGRFPLVETNRIRTVLLVNNRSYGIRNANNSLPYFYDNRVWSIGTNPSNINYFGIYSELSDNSTLLCNKILNTGSSIYFRGFTPSSVLGNRITNSYNGFTMGPNAVIGPQGDPTFASDNRWQGNFTNSKTFTVNTGCNTHSPFYMRSGNLFFPQIGTNLSSAGLNEEYNTNPPSPGLNLVSNPGPQISCPGLFNLLLLPVLQQTVREQIDFNQYPDHSKWMSKKTVYDCIKMDSSLLNDPIIDSFATSGTYCYTYFDDIETEIMNGDFNQAISLSNTFTANNLPEENYQNFYKIYATYYGVHLLPQSLYDQLVEIAEQCPLDGGKAVFESRALRDYIDKQVYFYEDLCKESNPKAKLDLEVDSKQDLFSIYPNPNRGIFNIHNLSSFDGIFKLFDMVGKEIYNCTLNSGDLKQIDIENIESGIFIYELVFDDGTKKNGKIAIEK